MQRKAQQRQQQRSAVERVERVRQRAAAPPQEPHRAQQVVHAPAQPPQQHRLAQRGQLGGDIVLHPSQPNRRLSSDMRGAGASS